MHELAPASLLRDKFRAVADTRDPYGAAALSTQPIHGQDHSMVLLLLVGSQCMASLRRHTELVADVVGTQWHHWCSFTH